MAWISSLVQSWRGGFDRAYAAASPADDTSSFASAGLAGAGADTTAAAAAGVDDEEDAAEQLTLPMETEEILESIFATLREEESDATEESFWQRRVAMAGFSAARSQEIQKWM